ncbi:hypothetical protein J3R83DRAFT_1393 [Lanmaoa asiatica]|nr:hypothetical protein J3R83DRAFT_1393 [Lanmaoa asiatica]
MSNRTTFRLPGREINPLAEQKCLLSLLAAYSRQWNPRNLEPPWYEAWVQIFADLIAGHASLSVAPQAYLWYNLAAQACQVHTMPGPRHLLTTEDEQLDEAQEDVGNMTLDSIASLSIPSHRNRCQIPDVAITCKVSFPRSENTSQLLHLTRKVTYVGLPLFTELKTSGARCDDIRTNLANAFKPMSVAQDQVIKQAFHLFQMYPHQQSVILVAITGFWWTYTVFSREQTVGMDAVDEDDMDEDDPKEAPDPMVPDQNGVHHDLAQVPLDLDEPSSQIVQEQLYGFSLDVLGDVRGEQPWFHTVLPENRMRLRERTWSDYLLYGTAPSNQVLSLILDRLHSVVHVHYDGRMG